MSSSVALRLSDVVKTYPGVVALKGVSFEVAEGEVHALVGENGAGKSTMMAVAAGSTPPDSGSVGDGGRLMTESLTRAESEGLFDRIRSIAQDGTAVVYISHRLPEVQRIADRITVLRDGETRGTMSAADVSEEEILRLIVGRPVDQAFPDKAAAGQAAAPLLDVASLRGPRFHDVDLQLRADEIVGLAGVEGNGQREFLRALAGLLPARGSVRLQGRRIPLGDPSRAMRAGIVHLPGDRHMEGLALPLSVRENTSLLALGRIARFGVVGRGSEAL